MSSTRRLVCIVSLRRNTGTMATRQVLILLASAFIVSGQRPFFAGSRPIGYPELQNKTTTTPSGLEDKFGEVTTQRLPIEALGDKELVDRLSKLPIDKQPFWFINWQALEADRQKPQTYPQRPNPFLESNFQNTNTGPQIPNATPSGNSNPGFANPNPSPSPIPGNFNPGSGPQTPISGNFNPGSRPQSPIPGNFNSGTGPQSPNWKLQDPDQSQDQLNNKSGNPSEVKPNTEASIPGSTSNTSIDTSNASPADNVNKPKPELVKQHKPEENEFADIQVKTLAKTN